MTVVKKNEQNGCKCAMLVKKRDCRQEQTSKPLVGAGSLDVTGLLASGGKRLASMKTESVSPFILLAGEIAYL
jgi:hypothetical protein